MNSLLFHHGLQSIKMRFIIKSKVFILSKLDFDPSSLSRYNFNFISLIDLLFYRIRVKLIRSPMVPTRTISGPQRWQHSHCPNLSLAWLSLHAVADLVLFLHFPELFWLFSGVVEIIKVSNILGHFGFRNSKPTRLSFDREIQAFYDPWIKSLNVVGRWDVRALLHDVDSVYLRYLKRVEIVLLWTKIYRILSLRWDFREKIGLSQNRVAQMVCQRHLGCLFGS